MGNIKENYDVKMAISGHKKIHSPVSSLIHCVKYELDELMKGDSKCHFLNIRPKSKSKNRNNTRESLFFAPRMFFLAKVEIKFKKS